MSNRFTFYRNIPPIHPTIHLCGYVSEQICHHLHTLFRDPDFVTCESLNRHYLNDLKTILLKEISARHATRPYFHMQMIEVTVLERYLTRCNPKSKREEKSTRSHRR